MNYKLFIFLIIINLSLKVSGQSFEGKLIYRYEDVYLDSTIKAKTIQLFGNDFLDQKQNSLTLYTIKGQNIIGEKRNNLGGLEYKFYQNGKEAYLLTEGGRKMDYAGLMSENLENIRRVQKSKEFKEIQGYQCRRYEYVIDGEGTQITAWIAEAIPYDKRRQSERFFQLFFLPDGLALEKRMIYPTAERVWTLQSIEIGPMPDALFQQGN